LTVFASNGNLIKAKECCRTILHLYPPGNFITSANNFNQKIMSFDKVKAMRNAERFLAQGKIRAAISEYKRVVEADKTDFSTLNMLGDLHAKASETDEAVNCFMQVAEHYRKQDFSQKAIAIYNKISRLKPDLLEVSAKLAQLYQSKGSMAEARSHYNVLAEQYTKTGKKAEALIVWKQIANLDPKDADIYLKIADVCWQEEQREEAASAYVEAGTRLNAKKQFESAVTAFPEHWKFDLMT
jgi:tetratricopeptide (TPR) repeat protein